MERALSVIHTGWARRVRGLAPGRGQGNCPACGYFLPVGWPHGERCQVCQDAGRMPRPPRRTNADKRQAVEILLRDAHWASQSAKRIAKQAGVSESLVRSVQAELQKSIARATGS